MPTITLLTGGARSGKSSHALELVSAYPRKGFIATAEAFDDEMRERIARHREERGPDFLTIEAPLDLVGAVRALEGRADGVVVDCLTVWLGNLMHHRGMDCEGYAEAEAFLELLEAPPMDLLLVTNEVGMGIIPGDPLTRRYRDLLGGLNRRIAARANRVILMVSGIPVNIKP